MIQALQASVGADVGGFISALQQAQAAVQQFASAQTAAADASQSVAEQTGQAVVKYLALGAAAAAATMGMIKFAESAIDAANAADPAGADKWNAAVTRLRDTFLTLWEDATGGASSFAQTVGTMLRPVLEWLMDKADQLMEFIGRIRWDKIAADAKDAFTRAGQYLQTFAKQLEQEAETWRAKLNDGIDQFATKLETWAEQFGKWITGILKNVASLLEKLAAVQDAAAMVGIGEGGDKLLGLAQQLGKASQFSAQGFLAGIKKGAADAEQFLKDLAQKAGERYLDPTYTVRHHGPAKDPFNAQLAAAILQEQQTLEAAQHRMAQVEQADATALTQQRLKGAQAEAQIRHAAAQEELDNARTAYEAAKSHLQEIESSSSGPSAITAAQGAIETAYDRVQAAGAQALAVDQERLQTLKKGYDDAFGKQMQNTLAEASVRKDAEEKLAEYRKAQEQVIADIRNKADADTLARHQAAVNVAKADSDQAQQKLAATSQANNESVREVGDIYAQLGQQQQQIDRDHVDAMKAGADYQLEKARQATREQQAWADLGKQALQSLGGQNLNSVIGGAQSMAVAGPAGMAAGAVAALIEQSKQAQQLADAVNGLMQKVADAIGQILGPLVPLVQAIQSALAPILRALGDLFGAIGQSLANQLSVVVPVIRALAKPLANLVESLAQVVYVVGQINLDLEQLAVATGALDIVVRYVSGQINAVAAIVRKIAEGFADMWDGILNVITAVFRKLGDISLFGEHPLAFLNDWANSVDAAKVNVDNFGQAMADATAAVTTFIQASTNKGSVNATAQGNVASEDYYALQVQKQLAAAADAQRGTAAGNAAADAADKAYADAASRYKIDQAKQNADLAYKAYAADVKSGASQAQTSADYNAFMAFEQQYQQLLLENSNATADNTKALDALTQYLNAPTGFKGALYDYNATDAGSSAPAPQQAVGASPMLQGATGGGIHIDQVVVVTNDPEDFLDQLEKKARSGNFKQLSTPLKNVGSKYSTRRPF